MYIVFMSYENKNIYISYWLLLITFLVVIMIVVGGLTRLTDSGLSITRWDLIVGIIPPLSINDWEKSFLLYQKIPEYKLINSSMTLEEFKEIYWWEYVHRLLGRLIGLFFLIPLVFFTIKKYLNKQDLLNYYFIFFLILLQGVIGWYMVMSGLTQNVDVSHYRLSLHLTVAFIILILLFWNYLKVRNLYKSSTGRKFPFKLAEIFIFLLILQISIGAFVSGLDAGKIYQTWPLMNDNYFPDDSNLSEFLSLKFLDSASLMQFVHRNLAYIIILLFAFISIIAFSNNSYAHLRFNTLIIFVVLFFQIFLGILTILSGANIFLASLHQIGSIILVLSSLVLVYKNYSSN